MARAEDFPQTGFAAGEVDERALDKTNTELVSQACRRMRNFVTVTGDAAARRPGSWRRANVEADAPVIFRCCLVGDLQRTLVFSPGQVDIYVDGTWTLEHTVTSCPWSTTATMQAMQIIELEDGVEIASQDFLMRKLTRASGGTWSIANVAFDTGSEGESLQPFYRYAARGMTLTPSALTGSINLTTSADHWTTAHVGAKIRWHGKEITITSRTSATIAVGTCVQDLFPTHTLTVASSAGFRAGQTIQGETSGRSALITGVPSGTTITAILLGYDSFDAGSPGEYITSETGRTTFTSSTNATPAASTVWDESMISAAQGYPGGVILHHGRKIYYDFPNAPAWLAFSSVNEYSDFDATGAELDSGFVDGLGENPSARIRHCVSAAQLLILTDKGPYYVPESADLPIAPTTWAVERFGREPAGTCKPVFVSEGVVWAYKSRIFTAIPTGNVRNVWESAELAELASHLISNPVQLAIGEGLRKNGSSTEPSRYLFCVNDDETLAVMRYARGADIVAWSQWFTSASASGDGGFIWADARDDSVVALFDLEGAGASTTRKLVEFSFDAMLDCQNDYSSAVTAMASVTGLALLQNNQAAYGISTNGSGVAVRDDDSSTVTAASGLYIGQDFGNELQPIAPINAQSASLETEIAGLFPRMYQTQHFTVNGDAFTSVEAYDTTRDPSDGLPVRTWTPKDITILDSGESDSNQPYVTFSQDFAAKLTITSIKWKLERS